MSSAVSDVTISDINSMRGWEEAPREFHRTTACVAEGLLAPRYPGVVGAAASAGRVSGLDSRDTSSWGSFVSSL